MTVVLGHFLNLVKPEGFRTPHVLQTLLHTGLWTKHSWLALFDLPPLRLLVAGHEAVVLFFVLSGFVLSLQCEGMTVADYPAYVARRTCRIYLPYLVALLFAIILNLSVVKGPIPGLNSWFNASWTLPVQWSDVTTHIFMLGSYRHETFNVAFWSIVHEMRISLVFPVIVIIVTRLPLCVASSLFLCLSAVGLLFDALFGPALGDYIITVHYMGLFGLGALLAQYRLHLAALWARLPNKVQSLVGICGLTAYCCGSYCRYLLRTTNLNIRDLPIALGASVLLLSALFCSSFSAFLTRPALRVVGQMSYSLYLVHAAVLFALVHLIYGRIPLWLLFGLYVASSLLLARLMYVWVELPCTKAGRLITRTRERARTLKRGLSYVAN